MTTRFASHPGLVDCPDKIQLFVIDAGSIEESYIHGTRERAIAVLSLINRALAASPEHIPNVEFAMTVDDLPLRSNGDGTPMLALTRQSNNDYKNVWLMPDFGYWSWAFTKIPSYQRLRQTLRENDGDASSFQRKKDQAVWRGKFHPNPIRGALNDATQGKPWADVVEVDIASPDQDLSRMISLEDMCKNYKIILHTEGNSYSGRLKYLQACRSVIVAHTLEWEEFHTHLLINSGKDQNYVEVPDNWANLETDVTRLLENPHEAEAIATRSYDTFGGRYLTPAAVSFLV